MPMSALALLADTKLRPVDRAEEVWQGTRKSRPLHKPVEPTGEVGCVGAGVFVGALR